VKMVGLLVAGLMGLGSTLTLAHGVHPDVNEIQAALAAAPTLSDAYHGEVQRLRADSERLHRLSKHHEPAKAMEQAATLLNKK
jgi:hypothetical protein